MQEKPTGKRDERALTGWRALVQADGMGDKSRRRFWQRPLVQGRKAEHTGSRHPAGL